MTIGRVVVEACVGSLEEAIAAEQGGADRLELCEDLLVGGVTPSRKLIEDVKAAVRIPIAVMVRPRGGSFVFSNKELDDTRRDLDSVLSLGADAVVIGVLDELGKVAAQITQELVVRSRGVPVTFHRAFDAVADQDSALDALMDVGITRVLTGGGPGRAVDGRSSLARLVERSAGRISIMAGGTVRGENVGQIVRDAGVHEVHARCERDPERIREIVRALGQE